MPTDVEGAQQSSIRTGKGRIWVEMPDGTPVNVPVIDHRRSVAVVIIGLVVMITIGVILLINQPTTTGPAPSQTSTQPGVQ